MVILDAIMRAGINLHVADGVYLADRDALVARAKILVNVHAAEDSALEMARVAYALANRRALVTELDAERALIRTCATAFSLERMRNSAAMCRILLADDKRRLELAERGFQAFSRRDLVATVRNALAQGGAG